MATHHQSCEYESAFEDDASSVSGSTVGESRLDEVRQKPTYNTLTGSEHKLSSRFNKRVCLQDVDIFNTFARLSAYEKHKQLMHDYLLTRHDSAKLLQRNASKDKRDIDLIRENHRFLWDDDDEHVDETVVQSMGYKLARKYCQRLYKEYCICDLTRFKENKVAFRWQTKDEVIRGIGQFVCANKKCTADANLRSWEVTFSYMEQGRSKSALVKVRLCPDCSKKLNYHHKRKEVTKKQRSSSQQTLSKRTISDTEDGRIGKKLKKSDDQESCAFPAFGPEAPTPTMENRQKTTDANSDMMSIWRTKPDEETTEKEKDDAMSKFIEDLLL